MLQEIRLYYESIEQAHHFILPIVHRTVESIPNKIEIRLVKLRRNYTYYSRRVAPIIFWKEPDILMTVIQDNEEYPLLLIEFSNAVFTEDHELQRFDGMIAAAKNNCIYAKISPTKKESPYEHGGKVEYDFTKPYSLIYSKYRLPYFHFEWRCDERGVVELDPTYLSCPKPIKEFEILLEEILGEILRSGYSPRWIEQLNHSLQNYAFFRDWMGKLKTTPQVDVTMLKTSRTRWITREPLLGSGTLEIKLNRFGHAMDPERGMLAYYGTLTTNVTSKMIFSKKTDAWYKDITSEKQIKQYIEDNGLIKAYDFLYCFAFGSGLYNNQEFMSIIEKYRNSNEKYIKIDLTEFIQSNFLKLSKPLRTIFTYSKLFTIEDDNGQRKVVFIWQPFQELQAYENYPKVTPIVERMTLDEDDVTYIIVHSVLRPNGYKIIAVSYPGAQGDRRILVRARTGRRQPREYIDIISFLPKKVTNLEESIGVYTRRDVQENIDVLSLYKRDPAYIEGLRNFQERFAPESKGTVIKIGVGFWASSNFTISHIKELDLKELDYFVYITPDRKRWKIWRTGKDNIFSISSGEVSLPKTYEVTSQNINSTKLSEFF